MSLLYTIIRYLSIVKMHKHSGGFRKNFVQYAEIAFTFKMWNRATKRKYGTSTMNYVRGSPVQKKREEPKPLSCIDRLTSARHKQRLRRYLCFILFFILLDSLSSKSISFSSFKIHHAPKIAIGISASIKIVKSIIFIYLSLFLLSLLYHFSIGLSSVF